MPKVSGIEMYEMSTFLARGKDLCSSCLGIRNSGIRFLCLLKVLPLSLFQPLPYRRMGARKSRRYLQNGRQAEKRERKVKTETGRGRESEPAQRRSPLITKDASRTPARPVSGEPTRRSRRPISVPSVESASMPYPPLQSIKGPMQDTQQAVRGPTRGAHSTSLWRGSVHRTKCTCASSVGNPSSLSRPW